MDDLVSIVHSWWTKARQGGRVGAATPSVTPANLQTIRDAMRILIGPCSQAHRLRAMGQIARADCVVDLWLLRSDLYQYLAQDLGQSEAALRIGTLVPLFGHVPPLPAAGVRNAHNGAHDLHVH